MQESSWKYMQGTSRQSLGSPMGPKGMSFPVLMGLGHLHLQHHPPAAKLHPPGSQGSETKISRYCKVH